MRALASPGPTAPTVYSPIVYSPTLLADAQAALATGSGWVAYLAVGRGLTATMAPVAPPAPRLESQFAATIGELKRRMDRQSQLYLQQEEPRHAALLLGAHNKVRGTGVGSAGSVRYPCYGLASHSHCRSDGGGPRG